MFSSFRALALSAASCLVLAPTAHANGFSFGFSTHGRDGGLAVQWSSDHGSWSRHAPRNAYGSTCVRRTWIPPHYEIERQRVWVEGPCERVWIEPVFEVRYDSCGKPFKFCTAGGHYGTSRARGHYEIRDVQVWQPGHWVSVVAPAG